MPMRVVGTEGMKRPPDTADQPNGRRRELRMGLDTVAQQSKPHEEYERLPVRI